MASDYSEVATLFILLAFQFAVDLAAEKNCGSSQIEPEHENDQRAERAVRVAVRIEEVKIETKAERHQQPEQDRHRDAGRKPPPAIVGKRQTLTRAPGRNVGRVLIDQREGNKDKDERDGPLKDFPGERECAAEMNQRGQEMA